MKRTYENIIRFDENYYALPKLFINDLMNKRKKIKYSIYNVPQPTKDGIVIDLYSIVVGNHILEQLEARYNAKDNTLTIETI